MPDSTPTRQSSPGYHELVHEAASLHGMENGYWDIWGAWHETPDDVRCAILASLGLPCSGPEELARALEDCKLSQWTRLLPPVIVACVSEQPLTIDLRLPADAASGRLSLEIRTEQGHRARSVHDLQTYPPQEHAEIRGARFVRKRLPLSETIGLGYHELAVSLDGGRLSHARLIICPKQAWLPPSLAAGQRLAGLAVSLYGVRSRHTWGCGDFTALHGVIDWVAGRIGGSYVALNPLHAIHNRQPYNTSPYLPNSLFYRNFIYLDIDSIPDMAASSLAQSLRRDPRVTAEIEALNRSELVEYERVHALKLRFLALLFRTFLRTEYRNNSPRGAAFRRWIEDEGELLGLYAIYSALDDFLHRRDPDVWVWQQWPEPYRDPDSAAVAGFHQRHWRTVLFYKYIQWQIDLQARQAQDHARARGMEIGLFHDLPLATDRCGFELWANRSFYVSGCRVGAPPDDFSPKGQDWSFPPPNAVQHRADGFRRFAETIRKSARHGGALRIDHVMRLFRLYWIPDGFDATQGAYVLSPHQDLLRVLALESVRAQVLIIGEDLGTVEPHMRQTLDRFGILSYRLFYFEKHPDGSFKLPGEYPPRALVSSTTHDLPTLAGFWSGRDIDLRRSLGLLDEESCRRWHSQRRTEKHNMLEALVKAGVLPQDYPRSAADACELTGELHSAVTGFLASTPSLLLTINQEDLTKETDQQNLPGTTHEYPNWRRKMKFSVEELNHSPLARDFASMLRHWLEKSARLRATESS